MKKERLTIEKLIKQALIFCVEQSKIQHFELYGVTDGKAVGTRIVSLTSDVIGIDRIVRYDNPQL